MLLPGKPRYMQLDSNLDVINSLNPKANLIRKAHELRRELQVTIRIEFAAIPTRIESEDIRTPTSKFNTD